MRCAKYEEAFDIIEKLAPWPLAEASEKCFGQDLLSCATGESNLFIKQFDLVMVSLLTDAPNEVNTIHQVRATSAAMLNAFLIKKFGLGIPKITLLISSLHLKSKEKTTI